MSVPEKNKPRHFAIYIDDMERAKRFYSGLFGWSYKSYGPQDFFQINTSESDGKELIGALQARKYAPIEEKIIGYECTIAVDDVEATSKAVVENGGKILLPKTAIPFVGWIIKFLDTEGNVACAMQYDQTAK